MINDHKLHTLPWSNYFPFSFPEIRTIFRSNLHIFVRSSVMHLHKSILNEFRLVFIRSSFHGFFNEWNEYGRVTEWRQCVIQSVVREPFVR